MKNKSVKVFAPATIANLGVGFDVLSVALQKLGDIVVAKRIPDKGLHFSVKTSIANVPTSAQENLASYVATLMLNEFNPSFGIDLELHKLMPIGSGLGSSAASCVAAAMAVNALLNKPLQKIDLLPFVIEGERQASGENVHADNVAASLLGGGCLIHHENGMQAVPFAIHRSLTWVVVRPHCMIKTAEARQLLPNTLSLPLVVKQLSNMGCFMLGLTQGNAKLIRQSLIDYIAEPARQKLIPGYAAMKQAAMEAGALGCAISGSGPTLFAMTKSKAIAKKVASHMQNALHQATGLQADSYISSTNVTGAKILHR